MDSSKMLSLAPSDGELKTGLDRRSRKRSRVWEVDFLRGLVFIIVFLYHLCWDFSMVPSLFSDFYSRASDGYISFVRFCSHIFSMQGTDLGAWIVAGTFLFLTGVCCTFSHNNALRGAKIFSWGAVITAVSVIVCLVGQMEELITFGILHCIGFTVLAYGLWELVERKLRIKTPPLVYIVLGLAVLGAGIYFQHWLPSYSAVSFKQMSISDLFATIVGTKRSYGDSFTIFPYSGLVLVGIGVGKLVYGGKRGKRSICPRIDGWWFEPVKFIGRHSLVLYLGEQVLAWVLIVGVMWGLGYTLAL